MQNYTQMFVPNDNVNVVSCKRHSNVMNIKMNQTKYIVSLSPPPPLSPPTMLSTSQGDECALCTGKLGKKKNVCVSERWRWTKRKKKKVIENPWIKFFLFVFCLFLLLLQIKFHLPWEDVKICATIAFFPLAAAAASVLQNDNFLCYFARTMYVRSVCVCVCAVRVFIFRFHPRTWLPVGNIVPYFFIPHKIRSLFLVYTFYRSYSNAPLMVYNNTLSYCIYETRKSYPRSWSSSINMSSVCVCVLHVYLTFIFIFIKQKWSKHENPKMEFRRSRMQSKWMKLENDTKWLDGCR